MDIVYLNTDRPEENVKSLVHVGKRCYEIPKIIFACSSDQYIDQGRIDDAGIEEATTALQSFVVKTLDGPDFDDAVKTYITYEGKDFYHSIHVKQDFVYGRYGFLVVYPGKTKIAYVEDENNPRLDFVDPQTILPHLLEVEL